MLKNNGFRKLPYVARIENKTSLSIPRSFRVIVNEIQYNFSQEKLTNRIFQRQFNSLISPKPAEYRYLL